MFQDENCSCFKDIYAKLQGLDPAELNLISEVIKVVKLLLVNPTTDAIGDRSFSTMRQLKTWLRSTVNQRKFNSIALLSMHKPKTDGIDLVSVANGFVSLNENRSRVFERFTKTDIQLTAYNSTALSLQLT